MANNEFKRKKSDVIRDGIVYRLREGTYFVCTYTAELGETVVIADKIGDVPVTALGEACLRESGIREVVIPESVKTIDMFAFVDCKNLNTVSIPEGITSIKQQAFDGCDNLKFSRYSYGLYLGNPENPYLILYKNAEIKVPAEGERVTVEIHRETRLVLREAFGQPFDSLPIRRFVLHDKLISVDPGALNPDFKRDIEEISADRIETLCRIGGGFLNRAEHIVVGGRELDGALVIPETVTEIAPESFEGCKWLKSLRFEGNISAIGHLAFHRCRNLAHIEFPPQIGEIGDGAFSWCDALSKVEFFEVGRINPRAFAAEAIVRPEWFRNVVELHSVESNEISEGGSGYPGDELIGLREIVFHGRVELIRKFAFCMNRGLKKVTGIENVVAMKGHPFQATPFESIFGE